MPCGRNGENNVCLLSSVRASAEVYQIPYRGDGEVNTKRLDEHDKQLAANMHTLQYAIRAIWLELGRSGTLSEETVISFQSILAMMRTRLDMLQREVEATAGFSREPACLNLIAHLTPQEKRDVLQALYEQFCEQGEE
jgi:hypothetical protein